MVAKAACGEAASALVAKLREAMQHAADVGTVEAHHMGDEGLNSANPSAIIRTAYAGCEIFPITLQEAIRSIDSRMEKADGSRTLVAMAGPRFRAAQPFRFGSKPRSPS